MNNKSIQILRGAETFDPATSEEVLLDGQPFYSKKTKQLYIGDGITELKNLEGTVVGLNLETGEGTDSIVQTYSGEVDATHYGNTNTGESAVVFGEANENSANRSLITGKLNKNSGANSIIGGLRNTSIGNSSIVSGQGNTSIATQSVITGENNTNGAQGYGLLGRGSFVGGSNNKNYIINSIVVGENNENGYIGSEPRSGSIVAGNNNYNIGSYAIVVGMNNRNSNDCAIIGGQYNANKTDLLFALGNGTSEANRQNALEVYDDGTTKINGTVEVVGSVTASAINGNFQNRYYTNNTNRPGGDYNYTLPFIYATGDTADSNNMLYRTSNEKLYFNPATSTLYSENIAGHLWGEATYLDVYEIRSGKFDGHYLKAERNNDAVTKLYLAAGERGEENYEEFDSVMVNDSQHVNGLAIKRDANGILKIGDIVIPQRKALFNHPNGLYINLLDNITKTVTFNSSIKGKKLEFEISESGNTNNNETHFVKVRVGSVSATLLLEEVIKIGGFEQDTEDIDCVRTVYAKAANDGMSIDIWGKLHKYHTAADTLSTEYYIRSIYEIIE